MRWSTSLLTIILCCGCASGTQTRDPRPILPRGEGIYVARYNPVSCAMTEFILDVEIKTALGWERVGLEDEDPQTANATNLIEGFRRAPHSTRLVRGDFTGEAWPFGQGHASRVFRLLALDPSPSADDPNRSISP